MTTAAEYYGKAYIPARAVLLDKAFRYLEMATRAETETKEAMAFKAACKAEEEAFKTQ